MKKWYLGLILVLGFAICGYAEDSGLLIDNFAGSIHGGAEATIDYGAGAGSVVMVSAETDIKHSGSQSLKVVYDVVPGGYMWVARGFDLDARQAGWLKQPADIDWPAYNAISFYAYGSNSGTTIAFDVKDNGNEMFRLTFVDDFTGWKNISLRFKDFAARDDWQPANANRNATIDFPLKSFQFEPLPPAKGTIYFADVELQK